MSLSPIDILIVLIYLFLTLFIGFWISKKASKNIRDYFLGGNSISWQYLGLSNASGMFDISGTMWMVMLLFVYGLKSVWIPWLWPVFNQVFMMIFLSVWLRRSGVMTGAEWIRFRFGSGPGATRSHIIVVVFALVVVVTYVAYGFIGIGKFASVFLPWELSVDPKINEIYYGLLFIILTTGYVVKGGMYSVVFTEVLQYFVMALASLAIGFLAMYKVSPETLQVYIPDGWDSMSFGWKLELDWAGIMDSAQHKITEDGWELFGIFFMMMLLKGILQSLAGPTPNYDMQRVLSTKSPKEAAKMSFFVNVVLLFPRYMLVTGLTILALVFFSDSLATMGPDVDFEKILPFSIKHFVPPGLLGILIAGLLAAFMSSFAASVNSAPAYVINDLYKRFIDPHADEKKYVYLSYFCSVSVVLIGIAFGFMLDSLNELIDWIVAALYGGYTASNLLKWYWWRFNGFGYFWGMIAGILAAFVLPLLLPGFSALEAFPINFLISLGACLLGSYATPPEDFDVLSEFYLKTRPWGFWGPIHQKLRKTYPQVNKNKDLGRDVFNVIIGIIWHTAITASAIFFVLQYWGSFAACCVIILLSSAILKYNWYDKLTDYPGDIPLTISRREKEVKK